MAKRLLVEQQVEARRMVLDAEKQLSENGDLLTAPERRDFLARLEAVKTVAAQATDAQVLKEALHALDESARPFVERIMNRAIAKAAVGHTVEDF